MVGRTYLERGRPVVVLARWAPRCRPRNVLIRRADGELVVRPFRGLRLPSGARSEEVEQSGRRSRRRRVQERIGPRVPADE
jgi:acetyl esterase